MEGMQIAAFAVFKVPEAEYKDTHKMAHKNCSLLFADDDSLGKFLIGRQICVTSCMFIVAKTTTCDADLVAISGNIFGSSSGLQEFYNTGLCGGKYRSLVPSPFFGLAWRGVAWHGVGACPPPPPSFPSPNYYNYFCKKVILTPTRQHNNTIQ